MASLLFTPWQCRDLTLKNRIGVAPMCQYSSVDGLPNDWHLVHLGSRAVGGAGLVMVEAAAVSPEGRISTSDMGLWNDAQLQAFQPITAFIRGQGAAPAIQLAHAGRKGSTQVPWVGKRAIPAEEGGWEPLAPSAIPFDPSYPMPRAMEAEDIRKVLQDFASAARRSLEAGFEVIELHAGHGYLLHEFLSPLSNHRVDGLGGSWEHRTALLLDVVQALRREWPERLPLFVRLSVTDWLAGGWDLDQSIELARQLRQSGVDLIDCSSGSILPGAQGPMTPGFQIPFADAVRRHGHIATAAVGLITEAHQAEAALRDGACDLVFLGRQLLRDPYWPLRAASALDGGAAWPRQYQRALGKATPTAVG